MAFKAEELMVQIPFGTWMWAACKGPGGGASQTPTDCTRNSQEPCDPCDPLSKISACQSDSQKCGAICPKNLKEAQDVSGLALLRQQMRQHLSQELPF